MGRLTVGAMKTDTIQITLELLNLMSEVDEFKGAWRALGTLAPEWKVIGVGRNHCANSPRVAPAGLIYFLQTIPNSAPSPNGNASIEYVQLYRIADGGSIP